MPTTNPFPLSLPTSNDALIALDYLGMTGTDQEVFEYAVCQMHLTGLYVHWAGTLVPEAPTSGKKRKATETAD